LFGACRHHDVIPWGDDIDIVISGEDAKKLRNNLRRKAMQLHAQNISPVANQTHYQWILQAKKDSNIILLKVADLQNGDFVDFFALQVQVPV
jgi:phosphorylcholine metabolism protein LicD